MFMFLRVALYVWLCVCVCRLLLSVNILFCLPRSFFACLCLENRKRKRKQSLQITSCLVVWRSSSKSRRNLVVSMVTLQPTEIIGIGARPKCISLHTEANETHSVPDLLIERRQNDTDKHREKQKERHT